MLNRHTLDIKQHWENKHYKILLCDSIDADTSIVIGQSPKDKIRVFAYRRSPYHADLLWETAILNLNDELIERNPKFSIIHWRKLATDKTKSVGERHKLTLLADTLEYAYNFFLYGA